MSNSLQRSCVAFSTESRRDFVRLFSSLAQVFSDEVLQEFPTIFVMAPVGAAKSLVLDATLSVLSGDEDYKNALKREHPHSLIEKCSMEAYVGIDRVTRTEKGKILAVRFNSGNTNDFSVEKDREMREGLKSKFMEAHGGLNFITTPWISIADDERPDVSITYDYGGSPLFSFSGTVECTPEIADQNTLERVLTLPKENWWQRHVASRFG